MRSPFFEVALVLVRLDHVADRRTMFSADTRRDGKRFVVRAVEKLTAFVELEIRDSRLRQIVFTRQQIFAKLGVSNGSESGGEHCPR